MSQSKRDQHWKKPKALRYPYTVRSGQSIFSSCPDPIFWRKEINEFKQVTYVSYKMEEYKELIENLKVFSNIEQGIFQ